MQAIILLVTMLLVSGCATAGKYGQAVNSWMGSTESALVNSWGPPDSQYQANSHERVLTYNRRGEALLQNYNTPDLWCKTHFFITDGIIRGGKWEGNSCRL